jgi:hypothetical protein
MAARKYDSSESKVGRPRKRKDIRKLVIEMALAREALNAMEISSSFGDEFPDSRAG